MQTWLPEKKIYHLCRKWVKIGLIGKDYADEEMAFQHYVITNRTTFTSSTLTLSSAYKLLIHERACDFRLGLYLLI